MKEYNNYKNTLSIKANTPEERKQLFIAKSQLKDNILQLSVEQLNELYELFPSQRDFLFTDWTSIFKKVIQEQKMFNGDIPLKFKKEILTNEQQSLYKDYLSVLDFNKNKDLISNLLSNKFPFINEVLSTKISEDTVISDSLLNLFNNDFINNYFNHLSKNNKYKDFKEHLSSSTVHNYIRNQYNSGNISQMSFEFKKFIIQHNTSFINYFAFNDDEAEQIIKEDFLSLTQNNMFNHCFIQNANLRNYLYNKFLKSLDFNNEKDINFLSSLFDNDYMRNNSDIINFLFKNSDFKNLEKILSQQREIVFEESTDESILYYKYNGNLLQKMMTEVNMSDLELVQYEHLLYKPIFKKHKLSLFQRDYVETLIEYEHYNSLAYINNPHYDDLKIASAFYILSSNVWSWQEHNSWHYKALEKCSLDDINKYMPLINQSLNPEQKQFIDCFLEKHTIQDNLSSRVSNKAVIKI